MSGSTPIDALAWLRERGVSREPIVLRPEPQGPPPAAREVANLATPPATHPATPPASPSADPGDEEPRVPGDLGDEVARALAFVRRSTANSVQSRGRLADKLADRGFPAVVVRQALHRAEAEGLVDDATVLPMLVEERRAQGHAPRRIRDDLVQRGFTHAQLDDVLAVLDAEDPHAAAFGLARERAATMTGLAPETAFRRIVAWLARRGYPEALARKAARDAIWTDREPERTASR